MADHIGLGEIFKVSNKGDGSYFKGERNHDDELLFEHSLRKSWKPGTHKYSETIKTPSDKEINYIEVVDNWKDGTNGERDVTVTAKTEVRVTITGVFGRGVNWDIRVYARPTPNPTPDPPELTPDPPNPTPDPQEPYAPLCFDLGPFEEYQGRRPRIADDWTDMPRENPPVLCVVTTADREYDAVVARLEPAIGHNVVLQVVCGGVPMLVGKLGSYQVALLQTHMGAHETRGALLQVLPNLLSVRLVMAIGFGYGLNPAPASAPTDGQMIGDVMISARCQDLSHYRATDKSIQPRGDVTSTQTKLVYVYGKAVGDAWVRKVGNWGERPRAPKIHLGTFISLPVLFNSEVQARPFVTATAHLKPIGGDMELFQIVSAVGEPGHPTKAWLAIKSICDFAGLIEKSKEGQPLAAATAVAFAHYFLSIPGLLDHLLNST